MNNRLFKILGGGLFVFVILVMLTVGSNADTKIDTDGDGVCDYDEEHIYGTDLEKADTDGDGFSDWQELNNGYSPLSGNGVLLDDCDYDNDGLSYRMELNFHTNPIVSDTDGDGYSDGDEIDAGHNPNNAGGIKLKKRIEIDSGLRQELSYFLGGVRIGKFPVSSGLPSMPTPKGHFKIEGKHPKAWSSYGLWMPYWMNFKNGKYGIHQLPIWPNGAVEGEDHLGTPASHGCVRLGKVGAEFIYNFVEIGTEIFIY